MRAAAVSSLAAFGAHCANLRPRVLTLLQRALFDNDDEVCTWASLTGENDGYQLIEVGGMAPVLGKNTKLLSCCSYDVLEYLLEDVANK